MRMPDPAAIHSTTGAAPHAIQRKCPVSAAPQSAAAPPIVHEVLRSAGQPLDHATRTFFEPRLGHDLSGVRTHTDSRAAQSAEAVDALAYTSGRDIVFSHGQYSPGTTTGQRLLAHELAHVAQQQQIAPPAHTGLLQRTTKVHMGSGKSKHTFIVGNIEFASGTHDDVLKKGALLPSVDQAHIILHGNFLGYEEGYASTDPFRWGKIKDLVDSDQKVLVKKVAFKEMVDETYVSGGTSKPIQVEMGPLGVALPTVALQQSINPNQTNLVASPLADTHVVYYTGFMGPAQEDPLAHELLGHIWLAIKGVPFDHPTSQDDIKAFGTLTAAHNILDPFGNVYTGTVRDFIETFVGSEHAKPFSSPTQNVGPQQIRDALQHIEIEIENKASGTLNKDWKVPPSTDKYMEILNSNFTLLPKPATPAAPTSPSPASPAPSPAPPSSPPPTMSRNEIQDELVKWYNNLSVDRQYVFFSYARDIRWQFNRSTELSAALALILPPPPGMIPAP